MGVGGNVTDAVALWDTPGRTGDTPTHAHTQPSSNSPQGHAMHTRGATPVNSRTLAHFHSAKVEEL
jgi:hypothetical protein